MSVMYKDSLKFPFQVDTIHKKKRTIKKELFKEGIFIDKKIAILGGSTTSEIKDILELFLLKEGIKPVFYESEFNRYYEDVVFENNALKDFNPDIIYIHTTKENLNYFPVTQDAKADVIEKFEAEMDRFRAIWQAIKSNYGCIIVQNNFELPYYRILGNLDSSDCHGKTNFIMKLNLAFADYAETHQGFYINDINYLSARFGLEKWHDKRFWYSYKYALSYDAISLLAHNVATIIKAIYGRSKKCLVLDLDNTLWGGVIGDDGPNNIKLGKESAVAEAFDAFQNYVKELKERGVILAVCSKNDFATAKEGFNHPDSILKIDDFASFKANWDPKHHNVKAIAKEINIGEDSLVFVDDNPAERELIRVQMSDVEVPEMGSDVINFIEFLDRAGYFEPANLSEDDMKRAGYYQKNIQREKEKALFTSYDEYLNSLEMKAEIKVFTTAYQQRITQLVNKTNQFNLTTKRRVETEIASISDDQNFLTLYGRMLDKFGDNGIISVVTGYMDGSALHIDTWLMSCRVIKREMELAMFDVLIGKCKSRGLKEMFGYYFKTSKNEMVADHYSLLGFELLSREKNGDSVWRYVIPTNYEVKNKFIKIMS